MVNISFVPRADWNAMPSKSVEKMTHPIEHVNFSICNITDPCRTRDECSHRVKEIQNHYSDLGLPDIIYNFIIGNDGYVYEGLGWDYKPGPNIQKTEELRDKTIDIGVICGHRETNEEASEMIALAFRKANDLVKWGVENKLISENYKRHGFPEEIIDIDVNEIYREPPEQNKYEFDGDIEME